MPYIKTTWIDGVTEFIASIMNKIEVGIETAQSTAESKADSNHTHTPTQAGAEPAFPTKATSGGKLVAVKSDGSGVEYIDPPLSLPSGGTAGQILTKNSITEGDAVWQDIVEPTTHHIGSGDPSGLLGNDGDVYFDLG